MTTFLLIRHGETDATGRYLSGWLPGSHLNQRGREQARSLDELLAAAPIQAVYSSPLERAIETAEPLAARRGLDVRVETDLGEMCFGQWEGMTFAALDGQDEWRRFNVYRSGVRAPGGELMSEAQLRMVRRMERLRMQHRGQCVALVSHGDPLRAALAHYLGISLDHLLRFEIDPASVSVVEASDWNVRVLCMNRTAGSPL